MKVIIKKEYLVCIHEKPYPTAKQGYFQVWQERTCTIEEFDEKFGKQEGLWKSKGKNHTEVDCDNEGCSWYKDGHKHCRRQMPSQKYWYLNFKTISDFVKFVKKEKYLKIYLEDKDGLGITVEV